MLAIDHIQLAIPPGGENDARRFFVGLLGMEEQTKPAPLAARGGCWFRHDGVHLHCGVEPAFSPQRKAHPAFLVENLTEWAERFEHAGRPVTWDTTLADRRRFYVDDPFGNRLEFIAAEDGFSRRPVEMVRAEQTG